MSITCPKCNRVLEYREDPPIFCAYCGDRLPAHALARPVEFRPGQSETADYVADGDRTDHARAEPHQASPSRIGGFRIVRHLGSGGMGTVYEAEEVMTGQSVAVKLLATHYASNPTAVERFRQEGKIASQISHPHCVFVYAAEADEGRPYIVMELMPGRTLKDLVEERGPLPAQEAIALILDVIDGLREAHRNGVIHRDVKPSNCFLMEDGRVKIGDFGLSKSLTSDANLTASGAFLGTVFYASPEQIRGTDVEYASDVYSVCATLFHLLTGRAPFQHENPTAALAKIISEDPPHVRTVRPDVPRKLARVVMRGLQRDSGRRVQNLDELHDALLALVPGRLGFGGLWVRLGAFILDNVLVELAVVTPLIQWGLTRSPDPVWHEAFSMAMMLVYFTLLEGLTGASLGKRLLRLRVCRIGSTDPPGLRRAALRAATVLLLIFVTVPLPGLLIEEYGLSGLLPAAVAAVLGLSALVVPMRRRNNYRGLHELLSGTCVMRLPLRRRAPGLRPRGPKRLDTLLPPSDEIPPRVGPYHVRGVGPPEPNGDRLFLAEDEVLGRKVILWLKPADSPGMESPRMEVSRPTRPRALGRGTVLIQGREYIWEAFVAPAGAPLADVIDPAKPPPWPTVRPLLEQLADELVISRREGTLPVTLDIDQVWVEPTGVLQLTDVIIRLPGTRPATPPEREPEGEAERCMALISRAVTLSLEGRPRPWRTGHPIEAPMPRHAAHLLEGVGSPERFRETLEETRHEPDEVMPAARFGQIGLQALTLLAGFMVMFIVSAAYAPLESLERESYIAGAKSALDAGEIDDPEKVNAVRRQRDADRDRLLELEMAMSDTQRFVFRELEGDGDGPPPDPRVSAEVLIARAGTSPDEGFTLEVALLVILGWPLAWAAGAYLFRGGISWWLAGISIVRGDGRPVSRRRAAGRCLLIWSPIALALTVVVLFQEYVPGSGPVHAAIWLLALFALPVYVGLATLFPCRPPQDRLLGTFLVPR